MTEKLGRYEVVPVAATLGLTCPSCGGQLEDGLGPFWCPACESPVSSWTVLAAMFGHLSGGAE
jgi:rubrerythrin